MSTAKAPGKLFIAGEYAVVTPGEPAVIVAVDKYVTVIVTETTGSGSVLSDHYESALEWTRQDDGTISFVDGAADDYVTEAIKLCDAFALAQNIPRNNYSLSIQSELDDGTTKYGLGSSAAVTVAVVSALNDWFALHLDSIQRYKLAMLVTLRFAPQASGGDVAASVFGGWILYTSPNRETVLQHYAQHGLHETVTWQWPDFSVEQINPPQSCELVIGWTGEPALTTGLIAKVSLNSDEYQEFLPRSRAAVTALAHALRNDDVSAAMAAVRAAREALQQFDELAHVGINTTQLRELWQTAELYGAAGKSSGAGGGDCGIVFASSNTQISRMLTDWKTHGIIQLSLSVASAVKE